jgi:hypothetical protein
MSKFAIRLLTLAITASVTVAPAMAETARKHHGHIHRTLVLGDPGQVWLPVLRGRTVQVLPEASIARPGLPMAKTPTEGTVMVVAANRARTGLRCIGCP